MGNRTELDTRKVRVRRGIGMLKELLRRTEDRRDTLCGVVNAAEADSLHAIVEAWDEPVAVFVQRDNGGIGLADSEGEGLFELARETATATA